MGVSPMRLTGILPVASPLSSLIEDKTAFATNRSVYNPPQSPVATGNWWKARQPL